jgi:hypothetical protein
MTISGRLRAPSPPRVRDAAGGARSGDALQPIRRRDEAALAPRQATGRVRGSARSRRRAVGRPAARREQASKAEAAPSPTRPSHLASAPALAAPDQQRSPSRIEIGLAEPEGLVDAQAGAPKHDDQSAQPRSVQAVSGVTHHRDDLLDGRRIGWIALALVARRRRACNPGIFAGDRRRPAASSSTSGMTPPHSSRPLRLSSLRRGTSKTAARHELGIPARGVKERREMAV